MVDDGRLRGSMVSSPTLFSVEGAASVLSYVVNPLVMPPLLLLALLGHFRAPAHEMAVVGTLAFLFFTAFPLAFLIVYRLLGRSTTLEVRDRARRRMPYLFGLSCSTGALAVLYAQVVTARPVILSILVLLTLNAALLFAINSRLKISIHTAAVSGAVCILLFIVWALPGESILDPMTLGWLIPAVPGVMWARVRSGAHSPAEVIAGAAFGAVVPLFELSLCLWLGIIA